MIKVLATIFCSLVSISCSATDAPTVGLVEQIPVIGKEYKVIARPIYIFTNKRLNEPTTVTGMVGTEKPYISVCCYYVRDLSPLDLKREIQKYSNDDEFGEHMAGIKGYTYMYSAEPFSDKSKWTSLMSTVMRKSTNPEDGSPFSAPVVAGKFLTEQIPTAIESGPNQTILRTRYDKRSDRLIFTFQQGKQKIEFSEPTFAH